MRRTAVLPGWLHPAIAARRIRDARDQAAALYGIADWIEAQLGTTADGHWIAGQAMTAVRKAADDIRAVL